MNSEDYAIALQQAIEYHYKGKLVPKHITVQCPHHAEMLNNMNDWTAKDGVSNSSDSFLSIVKIVEGLIRNSAFDLIRGRADVVARVITAQLAHKYDFAPPNIPRKR